MAERRSLSSQLSSALGQPQGRLSSMLGNQQFDEQGFQDGIRGTDWFKEYVAQYGEEPDLRGMSEDPSQGPNYDYRKAWSAGLRPERDSYDNNRFHWPSATPDGDMLKSANHPTAWMEHFMRQFGVNPESLPPDVVQQMMGGK